MKKALKLSIALIVLVVALQPCAFAALEYAFQDVPMRIEVDDRWALFVREGDGLTPAYIGESIMTDLGFESKDAFNSIWGEALKKSLENPDYKNILAGIVLLETDSGLFGLSISMATEDENEDFSRIINSFNFLKTLPNTRESDYFLEVYSASHNEFIGTCIPEYAYVPYFTVYNGTAYWIGFENWTALSTFSTNQYDYMVNIDEVSEIAHEVLDHIWIGDSRN